MVYSSKSLHHVMESQRNNSLTPLYALLKVTHPDGHYYYGVTKNIREFRSNLVRSYSALKSSNGDPNSHRSSNALVQHAYKTSYSPSKWLYELLWIDNDKSGCQFYRNKYIGESQDKHLCLNVYHNLVARK